MKPKNRMEDEDGEDTVFQRGREEEKEENKEVYDSEGSLSGQSLGEEESDGEGGGEPSLSFVTVKDDVAAEQRVVEGEGEESEEEEDTGDKDVKEEKEVDVKEEEIHLHFKMDTTLRAKDRVYISSYGNQVSPTLMLSKLTFDISVF